MFEPVIKWSGSKRSQANEILKYFPKEIDTYYEPFCGGASILRRLLSSNIKVNHYICSDLNSGLIDLWNEIINNPKRVSSYYDKLWNWLRNLPCKYALSFDGISGEEDNTWNVPQDVYSKHKYLLSGNSSFKRTIGKSNNSIVYESLYLK